MGKRIFTKRELERAWRNNYQVYEQGKKYKTNAHRLMLFYAVECGLKAIIMKREKKDVTDDSITKFSHNINKMLDELGIGSEFNLPKNITLTQLPKNIPLTPSKTRERSCEVGDINQMWRYGHFFNNKNKKITENDQTIEEKLLKISEWIKQEL